MVLKPCFSSSTGRKKVGYEFPELLKKYFVKILVGFFGKLRVCKFQTPFTKFVLGGVTFMF